MRRTKNLKISQTYSGEKFCPHYDVNDHYIIVQNLLIIRESFVFKTKMEYKSLASCDRCSCSDHQFACLHCPYLSCANHINHNPSHIFAVELEFGQIYCLKCEDYIYVNEMGILNPLGPFLDLDSRKLINKHATQPTSSLALLGTRGMENLSNTCYANCILQCFLHIPQLKHFFLSGLYRCQSSKSESCVMNLMSQLFQKAYNDDKEVLIPHEILVLFWNKSPFFFPPNQYDSHEFFMEFLHLLKESQCKIGDKDGTYGSLINYLFFGTIESELTCSSCKFSYSITEPFCDLSIELRSDKDKTHKCSDYQALKNGLLSLNLLTCLEMFTRCETLGMECERFCEKCRKSTSTTKQLKISQLPQILTIHLKRFEHSFKNKTNSSSKIMNHVVFEKSLDMRTYLTGSYDKNSLRKVNTRENTQYHLIGVVSHSGDIVGGHYTCHVVNDQNNWFYCDDATVVYVKEEHVLSSQAYILFYQKNSSSI